MSNQYSLINLTSELHELSSLIKLLAIAAFWFFISFGQGLFPNLTFDNQSTLSILVIIAFVINFITEIIIYFQKKNLDDFRQIISVQIIINTFLLLGFLILVDHINGPLFLLCTLLVMESSLNLNPFLPLIVVTIMGTFTVVEWVILLSYGQITPDVMSISTFIIRIVILIFLMAYGKSMSDSLIVAREVDKMKDEFISIASHELRTPMTVIKSYLWMALGDHSVLLKPKLKSYLKRSYDSTNRLIKLVNDMLNISRIESSRMSMELEQVQMLDLTMGVVEEFNSRSLKNDINIKIDAQSSLPLVIADPDKIKEVFFNLIGNSLKYTPKEGTIVIDFRSDNNFLTTRVIDNGSGMTQEMINNLFQKFGLIAGSFQTNQSNNAKGTGLGLYICKQIITLHHGEIWGSSPGLNKGSTFAFTLPIYSPGKFKMYSKQFQHTSNIGIIHSKI
ncbi:MAG: HAMP domain-containing sensor histidine kinase [Candidatus Shapirobacteria bacterium]